MSKLVGISFIGADFDLGYHKDYEDSHDNLGRIDVETFVTIEKDGEQTMIQYKAQIHDVEFLSFMTEEEYESVLPSKPSSFGEYMQALRQFLVMKISRELNLEPLGDYTVPPTVRQEVRELKGVIADLTELVLTGGVEE